MALSALSRGARFLRRASVPVASVGAGYAYCWTQNREETMSQYMACAVTFVRMGWIRSLRTIGQNLPEGAERAREKFVQVEASELQVLIGMVADIATRGLDSALLQKFVLRRLCAQAEADPHGLAVRALAESSDGAVDSQRQRRSGLVEFVTQIHLAATIAVTTDARGEPELLRSYAAALRSVVVSGGATWHEDLGTLGVLHIANAAALASAWLAAALRPASSSNSPALPAEDEQKISQDLLTVFQALGQAGAAAQVRSVSAWHKSEALELRQRYEAQIATLSKEVTPTKDAIRPPLDFLEPKLKARMTAILRVPTTVKNPKIPGAPVSASTGHFEKVNKSLEYAAWAVLIGATIVAMSEDGFGCLGFHAVPECWRAGFHSLVQQRGVQVEELLAKYDPEFETESMSGSIMLGPLGAQSSYIQAPPEFRAPNINN